MNPSEGLLASIIRSYAETRRWTGLAVPDKRVLEAIAAVPRDRFVPRDLQAWAFENRALDIGRGQTISQPFIVALMSELCAIEPGMRVLEIGTGSGYQAAVLAELGAEVFSVELDAELARGADFRLRELGYRVHQRTGDGALGWPEEAPFPRIVATAAGAAVPAAWLDQLAGPGRLIVPVGPEGGAQVLQLVTKDLRGDCEPRAVLPVRFVPLRSTD